MEFKNIIKHFVKLFLPSRVKSVLSEIIKPEYAYFNKISFSQEGEDLILDRLFDGKNHGVYVDVGAHHPYRYSNTFKFYQKGWRGINIDAMPESMKLFNKHRPDDVNVEAAIAEKQLDLPFYVFNDLALNTFDPKVVKIYDENKYFHVVETRILRTEKLSDILELHLKKCKQIDFMTIDVEGLDLSVLKSNNWSKFKPMVLLIEILNIGDVNEVKNNEIYIFLISLNYKLFSRTYNTFIFKLY